MIRTIEDSGSPAATGKWPGEQTCKQPDETSVKAPQDCKALDAKAILPGRKARKTRQQPPGAGGAHPDGVVPALQVTLPADRQGPAAGARDPGKPRCSAKAA